jgi:ferric-dicitrate binding protein FerR (iron transport regulator)
MQPVHTTRVHGARLWLPLAAIAVAILAQGSAALAQQLAGAGRILTENGRVSVDHSGDLWALAPGQSVNPGQILVTGADGYAQVELADHSIVEVFPNSRLVFRPNASNWRDLVDIYLGKIRMQIQHITGGEPPYHVTSPTAVISIRGTVLDVEVGPSDDTTVQVETGLVGVRHRLLPGREVMVETGQSIRVVPNVPLAASKAVSPLVAAGRIARIAGETLARVANSTGSRGGTSRGGAKVPAGGTAGSTAGTNQPAPPPGQDGSGSSSGGSGSSGSGSGSGGGTGGSNGGPPGDVIH